MKLWGVLSFVFGFVLLVFGPFGETKVQLPAFGNMARLLGLILIAAGIVMIKFFE